LLPLSPAAFFGTNVRLDQYLEINGLNCGQFAKMIGVSRNAVYYWCIGERRPSIENTIAIEEITDRQVTARDFMAVLARKNAESKQGARI
jgi:predicted transcriptional regulator